MCRAMTYRSAGAEALSSAIDILLLWSKGPPFRYDVGFHMCATESTSISAFLLSNARYEIC